MSLHQEIDAAARAAALQPFATREYPEGRLFLQHGDLKLGYETHVGDLTLEMEVRASGDTLILEDFGIYPSEAAAAEESVETMAKRQVGVRVLREIRDDLLKSAKQAGYETVEIRADRLTGAARQWDKVLRFDVATRKRLETKA